MQSPFRHPERFLSDTRNASFPTPGTLPFRHPERFPYGTRNASLTTPVTPPLRFHPQFLFQETGCISPRAHGHFFGRAGGEDFSPAPSAFMM